MRRCACRRACRCWSMKTCPTAASAICCRERLAALRKAGARSLAAHLGGRGAPGLKALKAQAVACYASQLRGLGPRGAAEAARPERYWQLDWAEEPQREDAERRPHLRSDFVRRLGC